MTIDLRFHAPSALLAFTFVAGCATSTADDRPVVADTSDLVQASPARVIQCYAPRRARGQLTNRYRVSADGKLHDGLVQWANELPDRSLEPYRRAPLDVSVTIDRDRLRIASHDATNGFSHVLSVSATAFAATHSVTLDTRLEETNDVATRDSPEPFFCQVEALSYAFLGEDLTRLEDVEHKPGTYGDPNVDLTCWSGQCSARIPMYVVSVASGTVRYGYDIEPDLFGAFSSAFPTGFAASRDGKAFDLHCTAEKCRIEVTEPDHFFDIYRGSSHP